MAKLLLVEDDMTLNQMLIKALSQQGHDVTGHLSYRTIDDTSCDLAILDVNLPVMNGFELSKTLSCPVIFLTARDEEIDVLKGFDLGCEDYITKPFSLSIFLEKVKVVLRHHSGKVDYAYKNLTYEKKKRRLMIDHKIIELTKKEHDVIAYLIDHKEQVISKQQLLLAVWDIDGEFVSEGAVNVTINRIRKKMNTKSKWIQTVFGIGYRWSEHHEVD